MGKKIMQNKGNIPDVVGDTILFPHNEKVERILQQQVEEADRVSLENIEVAHLFDEWTLRLNVATKLLSADASNETLRFLVEQAKINLDLVTKRFEAMKEHQQMAARKKEVALASLKKLQQIEVLRASGQAARGSREELQRIMTRTAQLELSDGGSATETRQAEYYAQALLEITMESEN